MGRIGLLRARWSALSRHHRLGLCAAALVGASLVGATVQATSGGATPAPVVWRDHVVDPTTTGTR
jgi:hypothetical protein